MSREVSAAALLGWLNADQAAQEFVRQVACAICNAQDVDPYGEATRWDGEQALTIARWEQFTEEATFALDFILCGPHAAHVIELQTLWKEYRDAQREALRRTDTSSDDGSV